MAKQESWLIIGGCGFLGRNIVDQLQARGETDISIFDIRKTFDDPKINFIVGDLTKFEDVKAATKGKTAVIHTASPPHGLGPKVYFAVNVDGTRNVLDACKNADETIPYCKVHMDEYNETKAIGEDMILKANDGNLLTIAIRPSGIFGPRDMQGAKTIIEAARGGKTKIQIGPNRTLFDWTYVDNAAYAHILAADKLAKDNGTAGQAFIITNDNPIFFWDTTKMIWDELGCKDTLKYILPVTFALVMAYIVEFFVKILSPIVQIHPTFTVFRIKIFSSNRYFNISKAKNYLGYKPIVSMDEGIRRTVAYFKNN
ncbi:hypothetical protein HDU76_001795 [Blyttiomyces sp. JEL0837]|nr:hypothetical protein HDU76_001795 [Blyttiomyces sp. JEL0837]